jgi:phytoene dehydrogenase-like protein
MRPLEGRATAAFGLVLLLLGHGVGWPAAVGGSQAIADAMASLLRSLGGEIETDREVASLDELRGARTVFFDLTPRQILTIAGDALPVHYRRTLARYRYGPGVFKLDYALDGPVPWTAAECRRAGTVHVGGSLEEIASAEDDVARGRRSERPYVLVAQQSLFDPTRSPAGTHTLWAYCHVPNGSSVDMTGPIEQQIERFAPGFRDVVRARRAMGPAEVQAHNANYIGGDINGGLADLRQIVARPSLRWNPYTTPNPRLFICSSSTPPGGGVHGMCGWHAARAALGGILR